MSIRRTGRSADLLSFGLALIAATCSRGLADGGIADKAILIIDPTNPDSMYVGNYYKTLRGIPDSQVIYISSDATSYAAFEAQNGALLGRLEQRDIRDHIDFVILAPTPNFYVPASGLISDGCFPVSRISVASAYTIAKIRADVLDGTGSALANTYSTASATPAAFDGDAFWLNGAQVAEGTGGARSFFVGTSLGYVGENGNTVSEVLDCIDRSVSVDGTHPIGTFYFCQTTDANRSTPRHGKFTQAANDIIGLGGQAQHLMANLPGGSHDCLGIMTGIANPPIDTANMTILPGAFCDHLTSFAGTFDTTSQTKMSRWIAKGASGTSGTVEEPCNYPGKFPIPRLHVQYFQGLTLGEAWLRSLAFVPFQQLFTGDPLCRPFAHVPVVGVSYAGEGAPVSGDLTLNVSSTTSAPGAFIARHDVLINGELFASANIASGQIVIDTTQLPDGFNNMRVLAYDNTLVESAGRWEGLVEVANVHDAATLDLDTTVGDLSTAFTFTVAGEEGGVSEVRLLHNGRVIASAPGFGQGMTVYGCNLGAGPSQVIAEVLYADDTYVFSMPKALDVGTDPGTPVGPTPVAFGYSTTVKPAHDELIDLPAAYDDGAGNATFEVLAGPAQASIISTPGLPYVVIDPSPSAAGTDTIDFRVTTASGTSNTATITILYDEPCAADMDLNGTANGIDVGLFLFLYSIQDPMADLNDDGLHNGIDVGLFLLAYSQGC